MAGTQTPDTPDRPRWMRVITFVGGFGIVAHQTVVADTPSWPLLIVALSMMGILASDLLDRLMGGRK